MRVKRSASDPPIQLPLGAERWKRLERETCNLEGTGIKGAGVEEEKKVIEKTLNKRRRRRNVLTILSLKRGSTR